MSRGHGHAPEVGCVAPRVLTVPRWRAARSLCLSGALFFVMLRFTGSPPLTVLSVITYLTPASTSNNTPLSSGDRVPGRVAPGDCFPGAPADPYLHFRAYGSSYHEHATGRLPE